MTGGANMEPYSIRLTRNRQRSPETCFALSFLTVSQRFSEETAYYADATLGVFHARQTRQDW